MTQSLGELTEHSLKNMQGLLDANSVIGDAITMADGVTILPVSRLAFGFGSGGSDLPASQKELFGGGSGGGVSITPVAFLVVRDGDVRLLQIQSFSSTADRVVGMVPDMVDKVSGFIGRHGKKNPAPDGDGSDGAAGRPETL